MSDFNVINMEKTIVDESNFQPSKRTFSLANLKDFLLYDGNRHKPHLTKCDLGRLCNEAYGLFRDDFRDLSNGEDVQLEVEGPVAAMADETLLMQILWNLYGNELKYGAPYGKVSVQIAASDDKRYIEVKFADCGVGMTKKEMRLAFNRYYRARNIMSSGKGGFGIGLCISIYAKQPFACFGKPSPCWRIQ